MPPPRVDLIGAGRLGSALAAWLSAPRPPRLQTVVSRSAARARALARRWAAPASSTVAEYAPGAPLILLAVPDDALTGLARQLAAGVPGSGRTRGGWRGKIVLHTSGLHPAAVLAPLRRRGAAIGGLHPLMSF
ncbi:MAG: NAD(P)-binding domain-containing protein, partial [Terriglobales bacterium]